MDSAYNEYLKSDHWIDLKRRVADSQSFLCSRCQARAVQETHHKTYVRIFRERVEDLTGLCGACHDYVHKNRSLDPVLIWAIMESLPKPVEDAKSDLKIHENSNPSHELPDVFRDCAMRGFKFEHHPPSVRIHGVDDGYIFSLFDRENKCHVVATRAASPSRFIAMARLLCPASDSALIKPIKLGS